MQTGLMKSEKDWPASSVQMRAVADLVPYAKNSRTHSDEQVGQIVKSMLEWGWTAPVLVDEAGVIIAGAGRILAAQKLGIEAAPVMTARGWTDEQKRAYVIADNQLALNAGWDMKALAIELGDLQGVGFDLSLIGFTAGEIKDMIEGHAVGFDGGLGLEESLDRAKIETLDRMDVIGSARAVIRDVGGMIAIDEQFCGISKGFLGQPEMDVDIFQFDFHGVLLG